VSGNYVYASDESSLLILDGSEAMSVTSDPAVDYPASLILYPAFPNPFNSMTTVRVNLLHASPVSIRIYDLSGRQVVTIVDSYLKAGQHVVLWDVGSAATGVYMVRVEASQ